MATSLKILHCLWTFASEAVLYINYCVLIENCCLESIINNGKWKYEYLISSSFIYVFRQEYISQFSNRPIFILFMGLSTQASINLCYLNQHFYCIQPTVVFHFGAINCIKKREQILNAKINHISNFNHGSSNIYLVTKWSLQWLTLSIDQTSNSLERLYVSPSKASYWLPVASIWYKTINSLSPGRFKWNFS